MTDKIADGIFWLAHFQFCFAIDLLFSDIRLPSSVLRESLLAAIRPIRAGFDGSGGFGKGLEQNFLHNRSTCLTRRHRGSCRAHARRAHRCFGAAGKTSRVAKTLMPSAFSSSLESLHLVLHDRVVQRFARARRARERATCGVDPPGNTLDPAKMLVFLSRCSNPNAVFAIPAGTVRHRHSLRLGGQHGEEAKDEDEIGGEKRCAQDKAPEEEVSAPLPSLRLRTTSMTASHGPARVEEQ